MMTKDKKMAERILNHIREILSLLTGEISVLQHLTVLEITKDTQKSKRILNHTLEIIYLLTGEEYTIVKKDPPHSSIHHLTGESGIDGQNEKYHTLKLLGIPGAGFQDDTVSEEGEDEMDEKHILQMTFHSELPSGPSNVKPFILPKFKQEDQNIMDFQQVKEEEIPLNISEGHLDESRYNVSINERGEYERGEYERGEYEREEEDIQKLETYSNPYTGSLRGGQDRQAQLGGHKSDRKHRAPNYSQQEFLVLLNAIHNRSHIIHGGREVRAGQRARMWREVAAEVSAVGVHVRDVKSVKHRYDDCRAIVKKKMSEEAASARASGGGTSSVEYNAWEELLKGRMSAPTVVGIPGLLDTERPETLQTPQDQSPQEMEDMAMEELADPSTTMVHFDPTAPLLPQIDPPPSCSYWEDHGSRTAALPLPTPPPPLPPPKPQPTPVAKPQPTPVAKPQPTPVAKPQPTPVAPPTEAMPRPPASPTPLQPPSATPELVGEQDCQIQQQEDMGTHFLEMEGIQRNLLQELRRIGRDNRRHQRHMEMELKQQRLQQQEFARSVEGQLSGLNQNLSRIGDLMAAMLEHFQRQAASQFTTPEERSPQHAPPAQPPVSPATCDGAGRGGPVSKRGRR
ncbi:uncharacterized protein O3C94_016698 [Discoglossus pictus]